MRTDPRTRALQNRAFLKALARTGNVLAAARQCGLKPLTIYARRRRDPVFATEWAAAQTVATAALKQANRSVGRGSAPSGYCKVRCANGRVQLRKIAPGGLDSAGEQRFLAALSATANVRLSAEAAGFEGSTLYHRAKIDPGFAREWRLALAMGYERLEAALIHSFAADSYEDDAWRHNEPPPIPPMAPEQALQLMTLHQKEVRLGGTPPSMRRRRGEPDAALTMRLVLMHEHRMQREREKFAVAEAARRGGDGRSPWEDEPIALPDLSQVKASRAATPAKALPPLGTVKRVKRVVRRFEEIGGERVEVLEDGTMRVRRTGRALFGGWRIEGEG